MANIKQIKDEALSTIDAAISILNKFPDLDVTDIDLSDNISTNPLEFLMDAFKRTCGYNILIGIISTFICEWLPYLEIAVKGVLLINLKNMLTCSLNPIIPDEVLLNGIVFDLSQIDITDKLKYSPLDSKVGKYYYFGCEDCETADDVRDTCTQRSNIFENIFGSARPSFASRTDEFGNTIQASDFDCLIWYMKNRGSKREVWSKVLEPETGEATIDKDAWVMDKLGEPKKLKKKCGILTLEYSENSNHLKDAIGNSMVIQTPYYNCLHVFIGNVKEKYKEGAKKTEKELDDCVAKIQEYNDSIKRYKKLISKNKTKISKLETQMTNGEIEEQEFKTKKEIYETENQEYNNEISEVQEEANKEYLNKSRLLMKMKADQQGASYRELKQNYYYKRTMIEFNTDYVMSLRLFDSKVVAAQILDAVVGLLSIDINLSYKQQLIRNEIKKMVSMVVQSDDVAISDCFFSFSNDDYNAMLEKSEMNKMGLFSTNGEQNSTANINAESILESLNGINKNSSKEEINTIIKGSLETISDEVSEGTNSSSHKLNIGVKMNFIEKLMSALAETIVSCVITPKLYLLILVNLEMLGKDTNFNLEGFITQFQQLFVEMIRKIRDEILSYFTNQLMKILGELSSQIALKLTVEQAQYYTELITKLINCFKKNNSNEDFTIDNVDYADITEQTTESKNNEC
jgi:hypothetical protein